MKLLLTFLISYGLGINLISAQYEEDWFANYGVANSYEETFDNYVDEQNFIYACGYAQQDLGKGGVVQGALVLKYDQEGNLIWSEILENEFGDIAYFAITGDELGNIYVAGRTQSSNMHVDGLLTKYASDGTLIWTTTYNSEFDLNDAFSHIALDVDGNICIGGYSDHYDSEYAAGSDFCAAKYTSNGDLLWLQTHNGVGDNRDVVYGMTVDNEGNLYLTGTSGMLPNDNTGLSGDDAKTIKYNANGDEQWVANYHNDNLPEFYGETPRALAVDSQGRVTVCGWAGNGVNMGDFITIQYDSQGNQLWLQRFDEATGGEGGYCIFIDENDNIIVGGSIGVTDEYSNFVVVKYTSSGDLIWMTQVDGEGNADDVLMDGKMDQNGDFIFAGYGNWNGINETFPDFMTVKLTSAGELLWVGHHNGLALGEDYGLSVAIDDFGNIFTTGVGVNDGSWTFDAVTVKYIPIEIIGVNEFDMTGETLHISPNPASGYFSLDMKQGKNLDRIYVVNAWGQTVESIMPVDGVYQYRIDSNGWSSGIYFVNVHAGSEVVSSRLVKN